MLSMAKNNSGNILSFLGSVPGLTIIVLQVQGGQIAIHGLQLSLGLGWERLARTNWLTTDSSPTVLKSMTAGVDFAWFLRGGRLGSLRLIADFAHPLNSAQKHPRTPPTTLNFLESVVSFVVSFRLKTQETIENKGWCAIQGSNL